MSALHYKGISHESREKYELWVVSCVAWLMLYFRVMMILLCSFAYHFLWSINTFMKTAKQQTWERVRRNKQTKKQQVFFFLRPSFSWGVRTCKKKKWLSAIGKRTGWMLFLVLKCTHYFLHAINMTWLSPIQSPKHHFFRFSFSRNRYGWIFKNFWKLSLKEYYFHSSCGETLSGTLHKVWYVWTCHSSQKV